MMRSWPVFALAVGILAGISGAMDARAIAPPSAPTLHVAPADVRADAQSLRWPELTPTQQQLLAPFESEWSRLPARRRRHLAARAQRWSTLPAARQQQIETRLTAWVHMTPAQRTEYRQNARAFHALSKTERADVRAAYIHFQSASPQQQQALRQRWRELTPAERLQWASGHHALSGASTTPAPSGGR